MLAHYLVHGYKGEIEMSAKPKIDRCGNPFRKRKCGRPDTVVVINVKGRYIPICSKCWFGTRKSGKNGIGESNWQFGEWGKKEYEDIDS